MTVEISANLVAWLMMLILSEIVFSSHGNYLFVLPHQLLHQKKPFSQFDVNELKHVLLLLSLSHSEMYIAHF